MLRYIKTDLVPMIANLVAAMKPYAHSNDIDLDFKCYFDKLELYIHPESILPDLCKLLSRIITFTPQEFQIEIRIPKKHFSNSDMVIIEIINKGIDLESLKTTILKDIESKTTIHTSKANQSHFQIEIPVFKHLWYPIKETDWNMADSNQKYFPPFFKKFSSNLNLRLSSIQKLEGSVFAKSKKKGVFLSKVNAIILANLEDEAFDISKLSAAMALSRSQLYRRLKPLIMMAPSLYIRYLRLLKAKELLEETDLTIGEVSFKTGFINQGHFSKIFKNQFGFNPSALTKKTFNNRSNITSK